VSKKVYDLSIIERITGGKSDRIIHYIDMYIELASAEISGLGGFLEGANWEELERTAHKMKAGSGYMGITQLQRLASEIEIKAAMDNPDKESLRDQIRLAVDIFESAKVSLLEEKKRLKTHGGSG